MTKRTIGSARRGGNFKVLGAAALLALGVLAAGCTVDDLASTNEFSPPKPAPAKVDLPASNPAGSGEKVSAKIDNSKGGEVTLADGTKIEVPAGALPPEVDTITVTSSPEPAPAEYKTISPMFIFEPDGTVFLKPLRVTIPVAAPAGTDTSEFTLFWSRSNAPGFDMVPTEFAPTSEGFKGTGEITHFSRAFCGRRYITDPNPAPDPYADK
jgi:hypothetical protein